MAFPRLAYRNSSKAHEIQLKNELQTSKRGTRSVHEYGSLFKCFCDKLSAIGAPVDNTDKVLWLLRGLGNVSSISSDYVDLGAFAHLTPNSDTLTDSLTNVSLNISRIGSC